MTGSWENASGVLESPGNFFNQESGNPDMATLQDSENILFDEDAWSPVSIMIVYDKAVFLCLMCVL